MRNPCAAFALLALAACGGGGSPTGGKPVDYSRISLTIVGGDAQTDTVTRELDQALAVEVKAEDGKPLSGVAVNFVVTDNNPAQCGTVFAGTAVTSAAGRAMERWTLGQVARQCTVEARAVNPQTGAAVVYKTFTATAVADTFASGQAAGGGEGAFPYATAFRPQDAYGNPITSFRLEAPAGAPIQAQGAAEGTAEARTLVRVDSAAWSATKPLGPYGFSGPNPYPNDPVSLRLYIGGKLQKRIVCAGQGRNTPIGRYDQTHPGRIELRLAPNYADPDPANPCLNLS